MNSELWTSFLLWCALFNYVALSLAFMVFVRAHDWLYRLHGRWFKLSIEQFDSVAYSGFGLYKLAIWFFLIIPALVIWCVF